MQKKYIPLAVFFVAILLAIAHFGGRLSAVPAVTYAESKTVYLTFDDGPSTKVTGEILNVLKRENVKATFFVVSDRVRGREEVLKQIAAEGHTLGVHSASHDYEKIYRSDEALMEDIDKCAKVIQRVAGVTARVYRFPGGGKQSDRKRQKALIEEKGYRVVGWNAVCGDEEIRGADSETLYCTAVKTSQGKNSVVLLLHDSAPHKTTAQALPDIIAYYRAEGYTFCSF